MGLMERLKGATVDFGAWIKEARGVNAKGDRQLHRIAAEDTDFQRQVAARGGAMTSSLCEPAAKAASQVQKRQAAELDGLVRSKRPVYEAERRQLIEAAYEASGVLRAKVEQILALERGWADFCLVAQRPTGPRVFTDSNDVVVRLDDLRQRLKRVADPVAPVKPVAKPAPVVLPNFDALVELE